MENEPLSHQSIAKHDAQWQRIMRTHLGFDHLNYGTSYQQKSTIKYFYCLEPLKVALAKPFESFPDIPTPKRLHFNQQ
jgi:hypothetical protein